MDLGGGGSGLVLSANSSRHPVRHFYLLILSKPDGIVYPNFMEEATTFNRINLWSLSGHLSCLSEFVSSFGRLHLPLLTPPPRASLRFAFLSQQRESRKGPHSLPGTLKGW